MQEEVAPGVSQFEPELRRTKKPPLFKGRLHPAYHSSKRSSGGRRNLPCSRGGGTRRITVRRVTEGLKPRSCAHVSLRRRGALRFVSPSRSPAGCRSSILCRWERHAQRAALSLRTSDRRHWCGNPFSPLLSRSPAARTPVGIRQAFPAHGEGGPLAGMRSPRGGPVRPPVTHAVRDSLASDFPLRGTGKSDQCVDQMFALVDEHPTGVFDSDSNPNSVPNEGHPEWDGPLLARCKGFEPLTFWSVARRSIQLS